MYEKTLYRGPLSECSEAVSTKPQSLTHGDNSSGIKELNTIHLLHFLISFKDPHSISKPAPTKLPLHDLLSLKGPSATSKGSIWSKMTGRVPCNTASVSIPPAIHNLHTARMDQTATFAYKESSFFLYSSCHSMLHFMKSFKPFEKGRSFSHPAKYKLQSSHFLVAVTFVTQN